MRINANDFVSLLNARGLDARWEQTGGGVGTIYVGPWAQVKGSEDYPFSAAMVGPGAYYANELTTDELVIGQDASYDPTYDDGGTFSWHLGEDVDMDYLVAVVKAVVHAAQTRWDSNLFIQRLADWPEGF